MQWITALLAFATTMLIFAIIVSTFVELIHRAFKLRGQGMQLMLENLYTRAIALHLTQEQQAVMTASKFATIIMENRAIEQSTAHRGRISRLFHWLIDSSSVKDIPVEVFTQKLADSSIVGSAENFTDEVLQDIAQKYEAFGHEISTYFGSRARVFSVGIAFAVVWLFYVNPYNLAVTYFKNPVIAQSVADKAESAQNNFRMLNEKLQSVTIDERVDENEATELRAMIDDIKLVIKTAQITNDKLAILGVPIGWPGSEELISECFDSQKAVTLDADERVPLSGFCRLELPFFGQITLPSIPNIFWLMVGGLLVGLGAPFWAKAVSSLTASRDLTRRISNAVNTSADDGRARSRSRGLVLPSSATPTHVKTFNIALDKKVQQPDL